MSRDLTAASRAVAIPSGLAELDEAPAAPLWLQDLLLVAATALCTVSISALAVVLYLS